MGAICVRVGCNLFPAARIQFTMEKPDPNAAQLAGNHLIRAETSDLEAIDDVIRGNREMFEVVVRRHNTRLYRVGMAYLHAHQLAEDAMQNAYLKAFLHLNRFNRSSSFATWLTRIMINECLMMLRQRRTRATEPLDDRVDPRADEPSGTATPDELHWKEMRVLLEHAIAKLPENHRAVYVLRDVQQLSTDETAECLGISTDSVKVTLHRARERLKVSLLNSAAAAEVFTYSAQYCDPMTQRVLGVVLRAAPDAV